MSQRLEIILLLERKFAACNNTSRRQILRHLNLDIWANSICQVSTRSDFFNSAGFICAYTVDNINILKVRFRYAPRGIDNNRECSAALAYPIRISSNGQHITVAISFNGHWNTKALVIVCIIHIRRIKQKYRFIRIFRIYPLDRTVGLLGRHESVRIKVKPIYVLALWRINNNIFFKAVWSNDIFQIGAIQEILINHRARLVFNCHFFSIKFFYLLSLCKSSGRWYIRRSANLSGCFYGIVHFNNWRQLVSVNNGCRCPHIQAIRITFNFKADSIAFICRSNASTTGQVLRDSYIKPIFCRINCFTWFCIERQSVINLFPLSAFFIMDRWRVCSCYVRAILTDKVLYGFFSHLYYFFHYSWSCRIRNISLQSTHW